MIRQAIADRAWLCLQASLLSSLREHKEKLEEEKRQHAIYISDLERRNVAEKNRLKKEMLRKVKETKLSLLAMTEDQLHTTTKRTIVENDQMTTELHYQSKVVEKLVRQNDVLVEENKRLKSQIELHEDAERILASRTHFFQKLIFKLNERIKKLELSQNEHATTNRRLLTREKDMAVAVASCDARAQEIASLQRQVAELEAEKNELRVLIEDRCTPDLFDPSSPQFGDRNQAALEQPSATRGSSASSKRGDSASVQQLSRTQKVLDFVWRCIADNEEKRERDADAAAPNSADRGDSPAATEEKGSSRAAAAVRRMSSLEALAGMPSLYDDLTPEDREVVLRGLYERIRQYSQQLVR